MYCSLFCRHYSEHRLSNDNTTKQLNLIPYFISLLIIGLPISWLEWNIGRYGGAHGHGTAPGAFNILFKKPWAKYLSSISMLSIMFIAFYYMYLASVILGYAYYSLTGFLPQVAAAGQSGDFFGNYFSFEYKLLGVPSAFVFFGITLAINFYIMSKGVAGGIEKMAKILMPVLLVLGFGLLVRVLTLPGSGQGVAFLWSADMSALVQPKTWLAAAGQIFFTLSIGMGAIINYASYIKRDQDITLSSLSANATNTFAEVILGGMIIIPAAAAVLGAGALTTVSQGGTFGLGFITMPALLAEMPAAGLLSLVWFVLLFFAATTSTVSLVQPLLSFGMDELGVSKGKAIAFVGVLLALMGSYIALDTSLNTLDEFDFWGGTFFLLLFGAIEVILFATHIDTEKGWLELHKGAHIQIPKVFCFILKYVTPAALLLILGSWMLTDGAARLSLSSYPEEAQRSVFIARCLMVAIAVAFNLMIAYAWKTNNLDERKNIKLEDPIHE